MDPMEFFYKMTIKRAFIGKGSPAEMRDTLRLAYRCGRIGHGKPYNSLKDYALRFLGLDCNGFAGNYHGISPALGVPIWANGPGTFKAGENGWGKAEVASAPFFPLKARTDTRAVTTGDVLVTFKEGGYKHVALVDDVQWVDSQRVNWRVVEWGQKGDRSKHIGEVQQVTLVLGDKGQNKKHGFAWNHKGNFRYLFAGPQGTPRPADFGRCGRDEI
jgi:hypothetical protein